MCAMLEVDGLSYRYAQGTKALDGVSLCVEAGERVAVLGANGSGKSTLFLCLNGVLKPQAGEIRLDGVPVRYDKKGLMNLRRQVGIVFQDPETQLFCIDVRQEVAFGPYNMGLRGQALDGVVDGALRDTGLTELQTKPPHLLSYGQKKRVSIASVLSMHPRVLIFDEPTGALDPFQVQQVLALLERFSAAGATILLSTHDVDFAWVWADRVLVVASGRIAAQGTPEEIFSNLDLLAQNGLHQPTVLRIFHRLVQIGLLSKEMSPPKTTEQLEQYIAERGACRAT